MKISFLNFDLFACPICLPVFNNRMRSFFCCVNLQIFVGLYLAFVTGKIGFFVLKSIIELWFVQSFKVRVAYYCWIVSLLLSWVIDSFRLLIILLCSPLWLLDTTAGAEIKHHERRALISVHERFFSEDVHQIIPDSPCAIKQFFRNVEMSEKSAKSFQMGPVIIDVKKGHRRLCCCLPTCSTSKLHACFVSGVRFIHKTWKQELWIIWKDAFTSGEWKKMLWRRDRVAMNTNLHCLLHNPSEVKSTMTFKILITREVLIFYFSLSTL